MLGVSFACVLLSLAKAASAQTCKAKAAGQKSVYIPGGKGVGCNAGGVKDCCYCVDDMAKCVNVFKDACYYTNEARRKEGFNGCQKVTTTPEPAPVLPPAPKCSMTAAGQKALYIPGGKGVGCNAGGVKDCCYCVDDMAKCVKVFKDACYYTNEARRKEGFNGCHKITTTPEPAPVLPPAPKCSMTAAGQKALYIPGGKGVGCNAGGVKDCCYCVDDMAACAKTFGAGPCEATYNARRKQGFTGCNKTDPMPEPAPTLASAQTCKAKAAGQKAVFIPGGKGVGCNAGGVKDCCFCIEEDGWTACVTAFGEKPCEATYNARLKQGFEYCHKIETTPEPAPLRPSAQTCDMKAAGQKAVFIPGGKGVGCNAGGVKDCCYCVDDMAACVKAFEDACYYTNEARRKEGFNGCQKTTTTPEPAPMLAHAPQCSMTAAGQKALYIPGGKGVGCNAGGVKDCCYCVDDMAACTKAFGAGPCNATFNARLKQGFDHCHKIEESMSEIMI